MKNTIFKIINFFKKFFRNEDKFDKVPVPEVSFKMESYDLVRVCPGGRHAWYNSNVGLIRKPIIS